ncbi:MAG: type II toxin-antitoxin system RelE/ParE family toxin [Patescibacteria group bacterium]
MKSTGVDTKGYSQIIDYLYELMQSNPNMARKAIANISILPHKFYAKQDIKLINYKAFKLYELKVQSNSNICRFFFVLERPNIIVLYGFTKKTQKTDKKDLKAGVNALKEYIENKNTIPFNLL